MAEKNGLKTVRKPTTEEEKKILAARRQKRRTILIVFLVLLILGVTIVSIYLELRSYKKYTVLSSAERTYSSSSSFAKFRDNILEYSNDGISFSDTEGELKWNQGFEMTSPRLLISGDYLCVYDNGGTEIFILNEKGLVREIKTSLPIKATGMADQGTIAVMMRKDYDTYVAVYDTDGTELVGGEFFASQGKMPVDIALSKDGQKMAIDMLDLTGGKVQTIISFYNYGSVGQNEVNNEVGTYTYDDLLIPDIDFISNNTLIAFGDSEAIVFEGSQKPKETRRIEYGQQITSVFHNEKYFGVTYPNAGEDFSYHIKVFDLRGNAIMENDTDIPYKKIELLSNNETCVRGEYQVALYTTHSIRRFYTTCDTEVYGFFSLGGFNRYMLLRNGVGEKIRLSN